MPIRIAVEEDLDFVRELNKQMSLAEIEICSPHGWNPDYADIEEGGVAFFRKAMNQEEGYITYVYENKTTVIAYMILQIVPKKDTLNRQDIVLAQLVNLSVAKGFRGNGIGSEMIDFAKDWAKKNGANRFKVIALAGNLPALEFYKSHGFEAFEIVHEMPLDEEYLT